MIALCTWASFINKSFSLSFDGGRRNSIEHFFKRVVSTLRPLMRRQRLNTRYNKRISPPQECFYQRMMLRTRRFFHGKRMIQHFLKRVDAQAPDATAAFDNKMPAEIFTARWKR